MNNEQILSIQENREQITSICQQILDHVAPIESEETSDFIDEFIDLAAMDKSKVVSVSGSESGGFGNEDVIIAVVVPIVVGVVKDLLVTFGKTKMSELQEALASRKPQEVASLIRVHANRVIEYQVDCSRSAKARAKMKELKDSVARVLVGIFSHGS